MLSPVQASLAMVLTARARTPCAEQVPVAKHVGSLWKAWITRAKKPTERISETSGRPGAAVMAVLVGRRAHGEPDGQGGRAPPEVLRRRSTSPCSCGAGCRREQPALGYASAEARRRSGLRYPGRSGLAQPDLSGRERRLTVARRSIPATLVRTDGRNSPTPPSLSRNRNEDAQLGPTTDKRRPT
jgi:hypothetical protein